jgi:hypothetical protein
MASYDVASNIGQARPPGMFDGSDTPMLAWLLRDLAGIDRVVTPWVVVMFHVPWYNSNHGAAVQADSIKTRVESAHSFSARNYYMISCFQVLLSISSYGATARALQGGVARAAGPGGSAC